MGRKKILIIDDGAGIRDSVFLKNGPMDKQEMDVIKRHPEMTVQKRTDEG